MARIRTLTAPFDPHAFLSKVGDGKTLLKAPKDQIMFSQGDAADAVFYIQEGKVKLTVVSQQGKEAVVAILEPGSFFGEACLAGEQVRVATTTAIEKSTIVRIDKQAMVNVLHAGTHLCRTFHLLYALPQHSYPGRLSGPTL